MISSSYTNSYNIVLEFCFGATLERNNKNYTNQDKNYGKLK